MAAAAAAIGQRAFWSSVFSLVAAAAADEPEDSERDRWYALVRHCQYRHPIGLRRVDRELRGAALAGRQCRRGARGRVDLAATGTGRRPPRNLPSTPAG